MRFSLFRKKPAIDLAMFDTSEVIYMSDDLSCFYPLVSKDPQLERESVNRIVDILDDWLIQDSAFDNGNSGHENTLSYQLVTIDVKFLPHQPELLRLPLEDNDYSKSASRFFDIINYIYMTEPLWVLSLLTGKFLYSQLYILPRSLRVSPADDGERQLPTRAEWAALLADYAWVPLLVLLQRRYDEIVLHANAVSPAARS